MTMSENLKVQMKKICEGLFPENVSNVAAMCWNYTQTVVDACILTDDPNVQYCTGYVHALREIIITHKLLQVDISDTDTIFWLNEANKSILQFLKLAYLTMKSVPDLFVTYFMGQEYLKSIDKCLKYLTGHLWQDNSNLIEAYRLHIQMIKLQKLSDDEPKSGQVANSEIVQSIDEHFSPIFNDKALLR
ncbi:hypothetical protein RF11_08324 [Thelohanellus kitauei]|uniref:Uncharacterized protein n=1 Tax=Thelohanellus kitauei TaxID=669202 RepID=A0A0C2JM67_THEKT|nr:hypothetical protein RF11_08324 [Thelohanellus kitauei]